MCTDIVTEPFFIIIFRLLVAVNAQKKLGAATRLKKKKNAHLYKFKGWSVSSTK